jgi:hypothetical protein
MNEPDSWLYFDGDARQFMVYAILGILLGGAGLLLTRSRYPEFGPPTERFGLIALHIAAYPLTIGDFYGSDTVAPGAWAIAGVLTALAVALLVLSASRLRVIPDTQWRWVWAVAQAGVLALTWLGLTVMLEDAWYDSHRLIGPHWIAVPALFFFGLVQAQVGLIRRAPWLVNLAIVFIGLHIVTAYFQLFGSMATTGMMFVVGGALLIGLAIYLERKRRALLKRMAAPPTQTSN